MVLWFHSMLGAWLVLQSDISTLRILFPWSWFVSVSCWHNYTTASFAVAVFYICYWSTLGIFLNPSNISLMLSSETMLSPSRLLRFQNLIFPLPCYTVYDSRRAPWNRTCMLPTSCLCPISPPSRSYSLRQTVNFITFFRPHVLPFAIHTSWCRLFQPLLLLV